MDGSLTYGVFKLFSLSPPMDALPASFPAFAFVLLLAVIIPFLLDWRPPSGYEEIPKTIWTYEPFTLRPTDISNENARRREGWARHHPEYRIVVLNEKNVHHYLQIPDDLHGLPALLPEVACLYALLEHGGVWLDASVEIHAPFIGRLFPKKAEGAMFCLPASSTSSPASPASSPASPASSASPFLLPTVIACQKQTRFLRAWKDAYRDILRFPSRDAYVAATKKRIPFPERVDVLESFLSVVASVAMGRDRSWEEHWNQFTDMTSFPLRIKAQP
jgi:hypothetical protein